MINRRQYLQMTAGAAAGVALALTTPLARARELPEAADESELIYLTPLLPGGRESRCQAEVWFAREGSDLLVVTAVDAWRAKAVSAGLNTARIWIGDVGVWDASAAYKKLYQVEARGSLVTDTRAHARVLDLFGDKYPLEWILWGPRFEKGLADGSRVMLRYQLA